MMLQRLTATNTIRVMSRRCFPFHGRWQVGVSDSIHEMFATGTSASLMATVTTERVLSVTTYQAVYMRFILVSEFER
jgi:hypothetical protein